MTSQTGVLHDARTRAAHALLTSRYSAAADRRLEGLIVPRPPDPTPTPRRRTPSARRAVLGRVIELGGTEPANIPTTVVRGVPMRRAPSSRPPRTRSRRTRERLRAGRFRMSWDDLLGAGATSFEAAHAAKQGTSPEDRLSSRCPSRWPGTEPAPSDDEGALRLRTPAATHGGARCARRRGGPLAGVAAFDAAHLRPCPRRTARRPARNSATSRHASGKSESLLTDRRRKARVPKRARRSTPSSPQSLRLAPESSGRLGGVSRGCVVCLALLLAGALVFLPWPPSNSPSSRAAPMVAWTDLRTLRARARRGCARTTVRPSDVLRNRLDEALVSTGREGETGSS